MALVVNSVRIARNSGGCMNSGKTDNLLLLFRYIYILHILSLLKHHTTTH